VPHRLHEHDNRAATVATRQQGGAVYTFLLCAAAPRAAPLRRLQPSSLASFPPDEAIAAGAFKLLRALK
jgi:hypothetical protein